MRETTTTTTTKHLVECPCGTEYYPRVRPCNHGGAEIYTARFRSGEIEGLEEGIIGPEGNRIPLWRRYYEEEGIRSDWFDAEGRAHLGVVRPYAEID